jgi:hypothetical protein
MSHEEMALRGTDPESYITEYTLVYGESATKAQDCTVESTPSVALLFSSAVAASGVYG